MLLIRIGRQARIEDPFPVIQRDDNYLVALRIANCYLPISFTSNTHFRRLVMATYARLCPVSRETNTSPKPLPLKPPISRLPCSQSLSKLIYTLRTHNRGKRLNTQSISEQTIPPLALSPSLLIIPFRYSRFKSRNTNLLKSKANAIPFIPFAFT